MTRNMSKWQRLVRQRETWVAMRHEKKILGSSSPPPYQIYFSHALPNLILQPHIILDAYNHYPQEIIRRDGLYDNMCLLSFVSEMKFSEQCERIRPLKISCGKVTSLYITSHHEQHELWSALDTYLSGLGPHPLYHRDSCTSHIKTIGGRGLLPWMPSKKWTQPIWCCPC